eukprot:SAG11_NODE_4046_length_2088_cov_1.206134_4_plen_81_part_00
MNEALLTMTSELADHREYTKSNLAMLASKADAVLKEVSQSIRMAPHAVSRPHLAMIVTQKRQSLSLPLDAQVSLVDGDDD